MKNNKNEIQKTNDKKYYLDLLKNSTNIIGTALIGPLWEIKSLITSFYGKVKDSLYNSYLTGIGYKFSEDNLSEKDIEKLSKKLEDKKFHLFTTIILDSMLFSKSHKVNLILGIITAKYLQQDILDYEDLTLVSALKDLYDTDLDEFINLYSKESERWHKEGQNIIFLDEYTNEQDIILSKLLNHNLFGKDKAGNRVYDGNYPLVYVKSSVSDRLYNYIISLNHIQ